VPPISPTSVIELGRSHVKKFHANIYFIQHSGESTPHQPGYHGLAGCFYIIIEPNVNREYSWFVGSVSPSLIF
jgi:hypothetical protein